MAHTEKIMFRQISILIVIGFFSTTVLAQDGGQYEKFNDKWRVYAGGFFPEVSSKIAINGEIAQPPPIDIEDVLGLEEGNNTGFVGAAWHISNRNSLEFEYFKLDRDGSINLLDGEDEPIEIEDYVITAGSINTSFDVGMGRLTYGFSVIRNERMDLQLKAGLHLADLSVALQLSGDICDLAAGDDPDVGCPTLQTQTSAEDVTAPLPHFGGAFGYAITPNIAMNINVIGFAIELDNIDGSLIEVDADVEWSPWRHFGIGAGLRYFNANVESKGSSLNGEFDFEYWGPTIFISSSF
jgi:hypothetical protein